jgi:glycosyltransferase involved in cell wall biosynthesis
MNNVIANRWGRKTSIAILIPCYNEEITIGQVVRQFRQQLPDADIYVFDNNSNDGTVDQAIKAGAIVMHERRQGKGFVVQSMFRQVQADVYVMVDGDGTYLPTEVRKLIAPILSDEADMVVGSRLHTQSQSQFHFLNRFGNKLFLRVLNWAFKVNITDMLTGYRAFNRSFVKGIPLFGGGFETETELTIKALDRGYRVVEVPVNLTTRPSGSFSKIRLVHDGVRILSTILALFRDYKPLTFFGVVGLLLMGLGLFPGSVVLLDYIQTGIVSRLSLAAATITLEFTGMLTLTVGLILHTITRRGQELEHQLKLLVEEINYTRSPAEHSAVEMVAGRN